MRGFFFQIVLFLGAAVIGIAVPLLPKQKQKRIAGLLAILLLCVSVAWTLFEIGNRALVDAVNRAVQETATAVQYIAEVTSSTNSEKIKTFTPTDLVTATFTSNPTNSSIPSSTFTIRPSDTVAPSATVIPTSTPVPNTPPGSILNVGDEWRQNDVGLRLTKYSIVTDRTYYGVYTHFVFYNYTDNDIIFSEKTSDFLATTGPGTSIDIRGFYNGAFWCDNVQKVVPAHDSFDLDELCGIPKLRV